MKYAHNQQLFSLSHREERIKQCEQIASGRSRVAEKAYYVVEDWDGRIFATDDPGGLVILRVCPFHLK